MAWLNSTGWLVGPGAPAADWAAACSGAMGAGSAGVGAGRGEWYVWWVAAGALTGGAGGAVRVATLGG